MVYTLINPSHINGTSIQSNEKDPVKAANDIWEQLSNSVMKGVAPQMPISIKDDKDNVYNYLIKEIKKNENSKDIHFKIELLENVDGDKILQARNETEQKANNVIQKQEGGKRKKKYEYDDDDFDDDDDGLYEIFDDDDYPIVPRFPLLNGGYWWYYPTAYDLRDLYIPTYLPSLPYMVLHL